jgi:predicted membrane protein
LGGYLAWKRPRFFGNTAPLLVFLVAIFLGLAMAGNVGYSLFFISVPFLILFAAGVFTDLLETRRASLVLGIAMGIVLTQAVTSFMGLAHLSRSSR